MLLFALKFVLALLGYSLVGGFVLILIIAYAGIIKMPNLYCKAHFIGLIDVFVVPGFILGVVILNFVLNGINLVQGLFAVKLFFIVVLFIIGSTLSTYAICNTYLKCYSDENKDGQINQ